MGKIGMSFDCKKGDGCGRDKIGQPMFTDTCGYTPDMERQQDGRPCVHGTGISGDIVGSLGTSTGPHSITDWLDLGWEGLTGHGGAGITVIVVVTTVIIALVLIEVIRRRRSRQISRQSRNRRREQQRASAREALQTQSGTPWTRLIAKDWSKTTWPCLTKRLKSHILTKSDPLKLTYPCMK